MDRIIASYVEKGDQPGFIKVESNGKTYSVTVHESAYGGGHTATFSGVEATNLRRFLVDISDAIHKNEAEEFINKDDDAVSLEDALKLIDPGRDLENRPVNDSDCGKLRRALDEAIAERNKLIAEKNRTPMLDMPIHTRHYMSSKFLLLK